MKIIYCENNINSLFESLQKELNDGFKIGGMQIVDSSNNQYAILLNETAISSEAASAWWDGYTCGLTKEI